MAVGVRLAWLSYWDGWPLQPSTAWRCDQRRRNLIASEMYFPPSLWLDPLLDSGHGFGAVCSGSSFASAKSDGRGFPHITKIEYHQIKNTDHAEFSGLWNSNAFRCHKTGDLSTNANVVTGKWAKSWRADDGENEIKPKSWMVADSKCGYFGDVRSYLSSCECGDHCGCSK